MLLIKQCEVVVELNFPQPLFVRAGQPSCRLLTLDFPTRLECPSLLVHWVSNTYVMAAVNFALFCVCVRACVRACVRVCVHVCVYPFYGSNRVMSSPSYLWIGQLFLHIRLGTVFVLIVWMGWILQSKDMCDLV